MLKLFCSVCPSPHLNSPQKVPYISIFAHKVPSDSPFEQDNLGILLLMVRDYGKRFLDQKELEEFRKSNCSSMPIDTKESRLKSISYPLYPDCINHTIVVYGYLSRKCLVNLFFAILMQMKIIIVTEKVGRVALIIESILKLVYPFDASCYTTIGEIQEEISELAGAPFPVIMGCKPSTLASVPDYEMENILNDCVIINLDSSEVNWSDKVMFPGSQHAYMVEKLEELKDEIDKNKDFNLSDYLDLTSDSYRSIKLQVMVILEYNMKIKKIFLNLMILLLSNYQDFWNQIDCEFEYTNFLKMFESSSQPFYYIFMRTQLFNTFLKDSDEENSVGIKEFHNYYSLLKSTQKAKTGIKYASFKRQIDEEPRVGQSDGEEIGNVSQRGRRSVKLKALTFKQNMEILNLLEAFDEDSDCDSQFDEDKNDSSIQVNYLDKDYEKLQTPDKYQSTQKLPQLEKKSQSVNFGLNLQTNFRLTEGRKRCDSGKLDAKDTVKDYPHHSLQPSSSGHLTERTSFEK